MVGVNGGPGSPGNDASQGGEGGSAYGVAVDKEVKAVVAKAIYDWFTGPAVSGGMDEQPPPTFNGNRVKLKISVDGPVDCIALADFVARRLGGV